MRIRRLRLQNYRRHVDTELELPDGVMAVLGRNGSGKSSILESIGFAFFGTAATRTGKDLIRHDGAAPGDAVRVELDVELGGSAISVVRELRGKNLTPQAELVVDGTVVVAAQTGSSDAVTQELRKRLGMDREAFYTTVVAEQKQLSRLADHSAADRKRLILDMLGVDALDRAIQTARGNRRDAQTRLETLRQVAPDLAAAKQALSESQEQQKATADAIPPLKQAWEDAKLALGAAEVEATAARKAHEARRKAESDLALAQQRLEAATRDHAKAASACQEAATAAADLEGLPDLDPQQAQTALDAAQALQLAHRERQQMAERLAAIEAALTEAPPRPNGALKAASQQLEQADVRLRQAGEEVAVVKAASGEVLTRLRRIADLGQESPCPVCTRPLEGHLPELRSHLDGERQRLEQRLEEARRQHDQAAAEAGAAREAVEAARKAEETAKRAQEERARLKEEAKGLEAALSTPIQPVPDVEALMQARDEALKVARRRAALEPAAAKLPAARSALDQAEEAKRRMTAECDDGQARLDAMPDTAKRVAEAERALAAAQRTERDAEAKLRDAEQAQASARADTQARQASLTQAKEAHARIKQAASDAELWSALAGARGGGLLDAFKSHLVARIGPSVSAEASRLLARFTHGRYDEVLLDDDYNIFVADGGIHYTLDRFSGGEADLVHLALRLAVSRLLLERTGADLRFLALDEVFGSLDPERREAVLGALGELGNLYAQVLVITHQEVLQDALDHALVVRLDGDRAVVETPNGQ